jgi:hypothetical protein
MIELQRDESQDIRVWADSDFSHVIVEEAEETYRYGSGGPGWYVRDENGERGPSRTFAEAFDIAEELWDDEVSLAPANRLRRDIADGRADEVGHFLLEYLADHGAVGIDVQALAQQVFARVGADEEAWQ